MSFGKMNGRTRASCLSVDKLWAIQPDRSDPLPKVTTNRKEESVLTRLHIGHSYLHHSFLLKEEEEKPVCIGCYEILTIEHILLDCWDFYDIRQNTTLQKTSKIGKASSFQHHSGALRQA